MINIDTRKPKLQGTRSRTIKYVRGRWTVPKTTGFRYQEDRGAERHSGDHGAGNVEEQQVRYAITSGVRFFLAKPLGPTQPKSRQDTGIGPLDEPSLDQRATPTE